MRKPAPTIIVEDDVPRPNKRRRLGVPESIGLEPAAEDWTVVNASPHGEITEGTIVCFGMARNLLPKTITFAHISRFWIAL